MAAITFPTDTRRLARLASPAGARSGAAATRRAVPAPTTAVVRRRRLVAAALLLSALLAGSWLLGILGGGPLTASGATSHPVHHLDVRLVSAGTYVVAPGDTLWSIARTVQPTGDVRPVVDALAGQLHGRPLQPGQTLRLP